MEKILERIKEGYYNSTVEYPKSTRYRENHVFNEDKSVKWNREEVVRKNAEIDKLKADYRDSVNAGIEKFENDVIDYLMNNNSFKNKKIAEKIYFKAYESSHSGGLSEVLNKADDLGDFVYDIIEIK